MDKWLKQTRNKDSESCDNLPKRNNNEGSLKRLSPEKNSEQVEKCSTSTQEIVENVSKKLKKTQKYRHEYTKEWPCLIASSLAPEYVFCTICSKDVTISHGGRDDCRRHIATTVHTNNANARDLKKKMASYLNTPNDEHSVLKAELLFTSFISEHNLPISCSDHAGPLFRKMFPDSKIASKYGSGRTKTTALLKCISSSTQENIVEKLKSNPFALATDGSNDKNDTKLYPLVVTYFSESDSKIVNMILSILECTDNTGEGIFNVINKEFIKKDIPWQNCVAFASDNAKTMSGHIKGVLSHIKNVQPHVIFQGCVCHLIHLAAKKGCAALQEFNVEEFLLNIYYFLQKSSKRQHTFQLCQDIYGMKPHKILKYVSTRWLSLYECIQRVLEQWDPLTVYFCEENDKTEHSKYLEIKASMGNPVSKIYLLFLKSVLPIFLSANTFLQQEKPLIHKLHKTVNDLLLGLIVRFIKPSAVDDYDCPTSILSLDCTKRKNQKSDNDLVIGAETRSHLKNIPTEAVEKFYKDVRKFYLTSIEYIKKNLPLDDELVKNAAVADVSLRKKMSYSSVEFISEKFPHVLSEEEKAKLDIEFSMYQFENFDDCDLKNDSADVMWYKISQMSDINGAKKFIALPKLILSLLLVPHSNANSERVFSLVRKNQTDFRPTLGTETLTSLLVEKQKNFNMKTKCYEQKFSNELIKAAKKSTWGNICSNKNNDPQPSTSSTSNCAQ